MASAIRVFGAAALVSLAAIGCTPGPARSAEQEAAGVPAAAIIPVEIRTDRGVVRYRVEVARTAEEQARGLMYRHSLPDRGGMLFPMNPPRVASFWMKNTYIPLDLIFIRADGTIESIAANAVPGDLSPIQSGEPVAAVLEISGGDAAAQGIAAGDVVSWRNNR